MTHVKPAAIILSLFASIFLTMPLSAQDCIDCHDSIDTKKFASSIHGRQELECTDCHGDFQVTEDGHDTPHKVNCSSCHETQHRQFILSIHGKNADEKKRLSCTDCHGSHYILSDQGKVDRVYRIQMNKVCTACHTSDRFMFTQKQKDFVQKYYSSFHYEVISQSGLIYSATCTDCHGSHMIQAVSDDSSLSSRDHIPETCGACHKGVYDEYLNSIHGQEYIKGNGDVPVCTDCHETHEMQNHHDKRSKIYPMNIPDTCLSCHADKKLIKKYNFSPMTRKNYGDSYHGAALRLGDLSVATCTSCHGKHNILPESDPTSTINRYNLKHTCAKCHKTNNPLKVNVQGKIHSLTAHQMHPISKWIAIIYKFLIAGTLGFFGFFIGTDLFRAFRNRRNRR